MDPKAARMEVRFTDAAGNPTDFCVNVDGRHSGIKNEIDQRII